MITLCLQMNMIVMQAFYILIKKIKMTDINVYKFTLIFVLLISSTSNLVTNIYLLSSCKLPKRNSMEQACVPSRLGKHSTCIWTHVFRKF